MNAFLGLGRAGIQAGGLIAAAQSAAMTGTSVASVLFPPVGVALGTVAGLGLLAGGVHIAVASKTWPCPPNGVEAGKPYVVAAHDWGVVRFWSFLNQEDAVNHTGNMDVLRRITVDTSQHSVVHGTARSWTEIDHRGENPGVDDEIRARLDDVLFAAGAH